MTPLSISLHESSGPVSPRYRYALRLDIVQQDQRVHARCHRSGPQPGEFDGEVPAERYAALWQALTDAQVLACGGDAIGPEGRRRVGVSFNWFAVHAADGQRVRFDYFLASLDEPAHENQRAVVALLKDFAAELLERAPAS